MISTNPSTPPPPRSFTNCGVKIINDVRLREIQSRLNEQEYDQPHVQPRVQPLTGPLELNMIIRDIGCCPCWRYKQNRHCQSQQSHVHTLHDSR